MKMAEILRKLHRAGEEGMPFDALFDLPCPRYDIVLAFLALLELLRLNRATAKQKELCGTIWVTAVFEESSAEAAL
jgi:chromatin segregation and condensation protein Rec8/ScpA/Scc1 (kleisin family)